MAQQVERGVVVPVYDAMWYLVSERGGRESSFGLHCVPCVFCLLCREMALELVSGADFGCKLMSRGSPGDIGGSRGRFPA